MVEVDIVYEKAFGAHGLISQSNKTHRKLNCQYYHSNLYNDITLYLATNIDLQLRSILALCEIGPGRTPPYDKVILSTLQNKRPTA